MKYITRSIEQDFLKVNNTHKVILVVGADQVGKITTMKHLSQEKPRTYVSLDDLHPRTLIDTEPDLFFEIFKPPMIIDDVHFAPSILHKIKALCDQNEETGLFWMACLPKASFVEEAKKVLGTRLAVLEMHGLSMSEKSNLIMEDSLDFSYQAMKSKEGFVQKKNPLDVYSHIWRGGLPQMQDILQRDKAKYFWHYFYDNLMYQVEQSKKVKQLTEFSDFLSACAVNICKVLSVRRMALAAGVSCPTATKWLQLLIDMGIIYLLKSYESDEFPKLTPKEKLYFTDTGFCSYIANWKTPRQLMEGSESDDYFENFVIMELVKNFANRKDDVQLRYFRNRSHIEVDVMIIKGKILHPFEISTAAAPEEDVKSKFFLFDETSAIRGDGGIICNCTELKRIDEKDYLLPCYML